MRDVFNNDLRVADSFGAKRTEEASTAKGYDRRLIAVINTVLEEREAPIRITDITPELWDGYIGPLVDVIMECDPAELGDLPVVPAPSAENSAEAEPVTSLACPSCKYDGKAAGEHGDGFRLLSDETQYREVVRLYNGRTLIVEGQSFPYGEDSSKGEDRIECRNCLNEFPIPNGWDVDYQ